MAVAAAEEGRAQEACLLAVMLTEQGLGGNGIDIEERLRRFRSERSDRAKAARGLARRMAAELGASKNAGPKPVLPGALLMHAFPDRIALQRGGAAASSWRTDAAPRYPRPNGLLRPECSSLPILPAEPAHSGCSQPRR